MGRRRTKLVPDDGLECFEIRIVLYVDNDGAECWAATVDTPDNEGWYGVPVDRVLGGCDLGKNILWDQYAELPD